MSRRHLKNIRKWKGGYQAYVQVNGKTYSKSYPRTESIETMRAWVEAERLKHATPKAVRGSFAEDITEFLSRIAALPVHRHRKQQLELWAIALGRDRPRRTITTAEIDRVLQTWIAAGLHANTIRNRRSALLALYHKLDGPGDNPVRASYCPPAPKPEARGTTFDVLERIIAPLRPSDSKTRLRILQWTGMPPNMLGKLTKADVNLEAQTYRLHPRRKGAGVEARTLPMLPQAVPYFTDFDAADLYGTFNISALNQVFIGACRRAHVRGLSLYDLRHSFLTMLYRVTKDLATVARFGTHADVAMTVRYAQAANVDVDRAAALRAGESLQHLSPGSAPADNH